LAKLASFFAAEQPSDQRTDRAEQQFLAPAPDGERSGTTTIEKHSWPADTLPEAAEAAHEKRTKTPTTFFVTKEVSG
jgi:hypothetical protein